MKQRIAPIISIIKLWLPMAIVITGLSALIYLAVQQNIRSSANDPQIQIAEDTATKLENGEMLQNILPADKVDITKSLAVFVLIFDDNFKFVAGNGIVNNDITVPPNGVFEFAKDNNRNILTWEPKTNVRSAIVVKRFSGTNSGYVVVGRSLREVEVRESNLLWEVFGGWMVIMIATLGVITIQKFSVSVTK